MKTITLLSIFLTTSAFAQNVKNEERKLNETFAKTNYWASYDGSSDKINALDSVLKYDSIFSKQLSKRLKTDPATISYNFKTLVENGMKVVTSEDGNFRIYSWDDETGGTMRRFNKIFQFRNKKKVLAKEITNGNDGADDAFYTQINDVILEIKHFM